MTVKITSKLLSDLSESIEAGSTIHAACGFAGISKSTYYRWMKRGRKEKEGKYRDFWHATSRSLFKARGRLDVLATQRALGGIELYKTQTTVCKCCGSNEAVTVTTRTLPPDSRLLMWILDRRYNDEWGRKDQMPVYDFAGGKDENSINLFAKNAKNVHEDS